MLKAVIFDVDGLMVDSTPLQQKANQLFLESFGKVHLPSEGGREGMRIIDIITDYKDIYNLPQDVVELYEKRQDIFYELVKKELNLFPGLLPLLKKLKTRNLKLGIATSGDDAYISIIFAKFPELRTYFSEVVTSEDVVRGKPYPDVYQKALSKLIIKPEEALVLEDSFNGIMAAKGARIQVIAIPNPHYPNADYSQADRIFKNLEEVNQSIA